MARQESDPNCDMCGGTGVVTTPAYQSGGNIVDEVEQVCLCVEGGDEYEDDLALAENE